MSAPDLLHVALSRRQVLVLGTAASAVLAAAYATLRQVGVYEKPTHEYKVLTPKEVAVLTRLGATSRRQAPARRPRAVVRGQGCA